ncbi:DUF7024 domain-containing protein [Lysobacter enzymogenes]|uniref:DUF7024 domain-containing protein n=1 Tax=Lysobacter enzymogenes TaxID=69 RepID=UPI001A96BDBF|nr:hypothetical protein [Lysobacter enzymogenes]QQP98613.1 hypothetical protein JHW38_11795 [Lysobacter enzymogenes]
MKAPPTDMPNTFSGPRPLFGVLVGEWPWWAAGAVFCFFLASVLMSGWPEGLVPNTQYPYTYVGDALSHYWMVERVIEGWISDNPRSGYPFGSNFLDYPNSDAGNLLILKLLGTITGNFYSAVNLYYLLSFSAVFVSAFCVLRSIDLSRPLAISAAVLYAFASFHFLRLGHLFYNWYFVAPLFFYAGLRIYLGGPVRIFKGRSWLGIAGMTVGFILLASFGIYYAFFGIVILAVAGLAAWVKTGQFRSMLPAVAAATLVAAGALLNLTPSLVNRHINGVNPEAVSRSAVQSEHYALKFAQLVLPRAGHRVPSLAKIADKYNSAFPLVNENFIASMGLLASLGLGISCILALVKFAGGRVDERLNFLTLLTAILFMFGTIGGFGVIFSAVFSPSLRSWNRISIFIAFGSITTFFIALQLLAHRYLKPARISAALAGAAIVLSVLGLYDQTTPVCRSCNVQNKQAFDSDRSFVNSIEQALPPGSAIYQLPYMPFPEPPPVHNLVGYELAMGFLQSKSLHWSYAGMRGRHGDVFYRNLASKPIEQQLAVIERMGFAGIYIDRRGFEDNANALVDTLLQKFGAESMLIRDDDEIVFFKIKPDGQGARKATTDDSAAAFAQAAIFSKSSLPKFVSAVNGMSPVESWGRWSDGNLAPTIRIDLSRPLPDKFTLALTLRAFQSVNQDFSVKIGSQVHRLRAGDEPTQLRLPVDLAGESVRTIEIIPSKPISPRELGINDDGRKLGLGLMRLHVEKYAP